MKRFAYTLIFATAAIVLATNFAIADCGKCGSADKEHAHAEQGDMHKCCVKAAEDGKGCCGMSADETKAAVAELKADYDKKVEQAKKKTGA